MGWFITLGILFLLAILPLGVVLRYDSDGFLLKIIAGPVKIGILPKKNKKDPKKDESAKPEKSSGKTKDKKKSDSKADPAEKPKGGSFLDFMPIAQTVLELLNDFRCKLRIRNLELKIIMGGGDPSNLAIQYGRAWIALGNAMPLLEQFLVIKKRDVEIECDFTADSTTVFAYADITITLGRLLALVFRYGIRAISQYLNIIQKRKGGASHEPKSS